jgi:hypothetical protein
MKRMNRLELPIVALALLATPALADIYTWVDESGVTHYSSSRPAGQPATTFPADPAFRTPAARARAQAAAPAGAGTAETQALRQRLEVLEGLLDSERSARVTDLKDQLQNERDRVQRLEAERSQWSDIGGLWAAPAVAPAGVWWNPAPVIVVPGHGKPVKPGKPKVRSDSGRLPYPSISGPSSNLR